MSMMLIAELDSLILLRYLDVENQKNPNSIHNKIAVQV